MSKISSVVIFLASIGFSIAYPQSNSPSTPGQRSGTVWFDSLKPWSDYVLEHLEKMTPRDLVRQMQVRNRYQRHDYPGILYDALREDGLSALLSYLKLRLHVAYSMPHKKYWIIEPYPGFEGIPYPDEWNTPADPWKREWWFKE